MEQEKEGVQVDSPTTETTVTPESATVEQTVDNSPQPEAPATTVVSDEADDRGVDYKNVAMEYKRKLEETADRLPQIIQEEIQRATKVQDKPKYSIEELETFAQENPQHRPWVEAEKFKLLQERLEESQNKRLADERKQFESQRVRKESESFVVSKYPDVFVRDNSGNVAGWNQNHPMTKLIADYMRVPDIQARPDALKWAAKLAYADYQDMKAPTTAKQVKKLKTEVKKIQQKTLVEGGTRPAAPSSDSKRTALEQLAKTGSEKDARSAVREILKASGMIRD